MRIRHRLAIGYCLLAAARVQAGEAEFHSLYKELVEINTTLSAVSCTEAAARRAPT